MHRCTWYRHLSGGTSGNLCQVMRDPRIRRFMGKHARVMLLLKDPSRPVEEANIRGIKVSPHIFKLEPLAFYSQPF